MRIKPFGLGLERYFAKYEFSVKYLLSSFDCDGLPQSEVLLGAVFLKEKYKGLKQKRKFLRISATNNMKNFFYKM
jgi:hypothetical protein